MPTFFLPSPLFIKDQLLQAGPSPELSKKIHGVGHGFRVQPAVAPGPCPPLRRRALRRRPHPPSQTPSPHPPTTNAHLGPAEVMGLQQLHGRAKDSSPTPVTLSRITRKSVAPLRISEFALHHHSSINSTNVSSNSSLSSLSMACLKWRLKDFLLFKSASEGSSRPLLEEEPKKKVKKTSTPLCKQGLLGCMSFTSCGHHHKLSPEFDCSCS